MNEYRGYITTCHNGYTKDPYNPLIMAIKWHAFFLIIVALQGFHKLPVLMARKWVTHEWYNGCMQGITPTCHNRYTGVLTSLY
jgi:hypothetical protein